MESFMKTLPGPMQINESIIVIAVIFILLYLILKKFYIKPYLFILEERENRIVGAENRFKEVEDYYREKIKQYEDEIKKARVNANALREKLVNEAKKEREKIVNTAKMQAHEVIEKSARELDSALKKELKEAENYVEVIAKMIVEKIIGRKLA
ncbi:F-type H+-transporting ATPase subunit b [Thermotomaculum hydrothermale]|uniref:ATP synthase subunit b n=1 Tax=Thermotomaculum hydrothermale TaxID=981385 RepID=A0A7R6SZ96_9BACT|nr:ATP synthase F0 subunit B [Thermotomaculum hydrothermale]BBB32522.1 F-type H+-transporting ATPase subunit b [Thermotomaculum hydrothermale]